MNVRDLELGKWKEDDQKFTSDGLNERNHTHTNTHTHTHTNTEWLVENTVLFNLPDAVSLYIVPHVVVAPNHKIIFVATS